MALFYECMLSCAQRVLEIADIVYALGKFGRGGNRRRNGETSYWNPAGVSLARPKRASRPVASVAIHRVTGGREAYTARKQAVKIQLRKSACCDAEAVDKAEGNIRSSDIARSRRDRRSPLSRGMLPKGFSRNPGEFAIALREETSRRGRLEANGTDKGSILRPYSACEGGEPQCFGKERPRYPLEGREEKRTDLPKET